MFVVKFSIEQTLSRRANDFETDLLYNLNLLQENVGAVDVFPSAASLADYTNTVQIDWEILPPGSVGEVLKRMLQGKRTVEADLQKVMEQRLGVVSRFKPEAYIAGTIRPPSPCAVSYRQQFSTHIHSDELLMTAKKIKAERH